MFCSTALVYLTGYRGFSKDAVVVKENGLYAWISITFQVFGLHVDCLTLLLYE